jgi:predicted anti-sigma-YlaC factor YlaD
MECERAREAISARIDGEDPGVPDGALQAHLDGCASCRDWQQRAHVMTRRARLGGAFLDRDLTGQVLAAHELGSFDLALAIAFAVGAIRPALSAGLAWTCAIAAAGLAGTAIADLIGGQAIGADEAQHLIAVAGAVLLIWQARIAGPGAADAGTADATDWPQSAPGSLAADPGTVSRLDGSPRFPGGAARATAPDTVRETQAAGPPDDAERHDVRHTA